MKMMRSRLQVSNTSPVNSEQQESDATRWRRHRMDEEEGKNVIHLYSSSPFICFSTQISHSSQGERENLNGIGAHISALAEDGSIKHKQRAERIWIRVERSKQERWDEEMKLLAPFATLFTLVSLLLLCCCYHHLIIFVTASTELSSSLLPHTSSSSSPSYYSMLVNLSLSSLLRMKYDPSAPITFLPSSQKSFSSILSSSDDGPLAPFKLR